MAAKRLVRLSGLAVGHVDFAVARAAAYEQTAPVGRVLDETDVPDRTIVHSQLDLLALQVRRVRVEPHQLHRLIVAPGRYQRAVRRPRHAVYRALVVSGAFEQHGRLLGHVVLSETRGFRLSIRRKKKKNTDLVVATLLHAK